MHRVLFSVFFGICALALSACTTFPTKKPTCASCGTVVSIIRSDAAHAGANGGGVVLGGIVGGVAVPHPTQPAGPVTLTGYDIRVRMDDGHQVTVHQTDVKGLHPNAPVRVINGKVVAATVVTAKP